MAYTQNHNQNCPCSLCYSLRGGGAGSTTVTTHLLGAVSMNNTERRLENEIHKVLQEELADSAIYQDSYAELTLKRHLQNTESRLSVLFHQALAEVRERYTKDINFLKKLHSMELDALSLKSLEDFMKWADNRRHTPISPTLSSLDTPEKQKPFYVKVPLELDTKGNQIRYPLTDNKRDDKKDK